MCFVLIGKVLESINKQLLLLSVLLALSGCVSQKPEKSFSQLEVTGHMELVYANQFRADYLEGGCTLITIGGEDKFLLVPEGIEPPPDLDGDIILLRQPVENIYLAATSAMCLFDALGSIDRITMSGTKAEGWYVENARLAMERGEIVYAGKYSAPDYELLTAKNCGIAIESTMIYQRPEVKEKIEALGIPVLTERSSYENHPLGRTEWIKLYGLILGKEALAEEIFLEQAAYLDSIPGENTGKTVAFFYISSSGGVVARKNGDYAVKMIELAGGNYVFSHLERTEGGAGSLNLEMERFYADAKDADIIIYNSAIDGEVATLAEFLSKSPLLADFKAVENNSVWCTGKNLFQETTEFGLMISELRKIFSGEAEEGKLNYYYRLR